MVSKTAKETMVVRTATSETQVVRDEACYEGHVLEACIPPYRTAEPQ